MYNIITKQKVDRYIYDHEKDIRSIVKQVVGDLEIEHLEEINIPEYGMFKSDVISFQRSKGLREGCTDDNGRYAAGKTISYHNDDILKSTIFLYSDTIHKLSKTDTRQDAIYTIHHEICHVHDDWHKVKILGREFCFRKTASFDLAPKVESLAIWSEYFACRKSANSLVDKCLNGRLLIQDVLRTEEEITSQILAYKYHGDIDSLYSYAWSSVVNLIMLAARTLGDLHGTVNINKQPTCIASNYFILFENSYFRSSWISLGIELERLFNLYSEWSGIEELNVLAKIIMDTLAILGFEPGIDNGRIYINGRYLDMLG